jgi:hypothetical protein
VANRTKGRKKAEGSGGRPFQSKLEPFFDEIWSLRKKRQTWDAIAKHITATNGVSCTAPGVYSFWKSRRKRRYPAGMDPNETLLESAPKQPPSVQTDLPESKPVTPAELMKKRSFHELEPKAKEDPYAY